MRQDRAAAWHKARWWGYIVIWPFYVYELIDPRNGAVFYVGKGSGNRIDEHEKETAAGVRSKKCNKIRSIGGSGLKIGKRKVASFKDEADAYAFEDQRIREYGKQNLCNVAPLVDELKAVAEPFLSRDFFRCVALIAKICAGRIEIPPDSRPFSQAMHLAVKRRGPQGFIQNALKRISFEELRDGLRRFGVELVRGS